MNNRLILKGKIGWPYGMIPEHLPQVLEIERQSARDQANERNGIVAPWERNIFEYYIIEAGTSYQEVFMHCHKIAGFIVVNGMEILNMAVRQDLRRLGIGTRMINWVKKEIYRPGKQISVRVRETNEQFLRFLIENGFTPYRKMLRDEFPDLRQPPQDFLAEDGILMLYGHVKSPTLTYNNRIKLFFK